MRLTDLPLHAAVLTLLVSGVITIAPNRAAVAADSPRAWLLLEVETPVQAADVPAAAPPRFVLFEDGAVYVGGSRALLQGRLSSSEVKQLERRADAVRKLGGIPTLLRWGSASVRWRLFIYRGKPMQFEIVGHVEDAPASLAPLASLLRELSQFDHESLRAYEPASYRMTVRAGHLDGGCRTWAGEPLIEGVRIVPAAVARDWPTGMRPAFVCEGDKRFVVTFRPMLPGEKP